MSSDFRFQFHSCIVNKKYIGFDKHGDLIEQKKRVTPLALALPVAGILLHQMDNRSVTDVRKILDDLTLLEKRYKKCINSCGWKFKKFICMLLVALKILKVNPFAKHEEEALKALKEFRERLHQMCLEPAVEAERVPEPLLLKAEPLPEPLPLPIEVKPGEAQPHADVEGLLKELEADLIAHVTEVRLQQHSVAFQRCKGTQAELEKGGLAQEYLLGLLKKNPQFPMEIDNKLYWLELKEPAITAFMPGATLKQFHAVPPELSVINRPVVQKLSLTQSDIAINCLKKLIKALQRDKLPTEIEGFKKINLRDIGPDFFALLPWISSKEAVEIDCSGVVLAGEQFKQLLRSFPGIQKLDLRGSHLDLPKMLQDLPYLEHLSLDAVDKSDQLLRHLAIDGLKDCTVHTENGDEQVEIHYNEASGFYPRYLPIPRDLGEVKQYLSQEDRSLFLDLIEKRKEVKILTVESAETFSFLFKKGYVNPAAAQALMAQCIQIAQAYLEEVKGSLRTQLKELGVIVVGALSVKLDEIGQDKPLQGVILSDDPAVNAKVSETEIPQLLMLRFNLQGFDEAFCQAFDKIVEASYAELMANM